MLKFEKMRFWQTALPLLAIAAGCNKGPTMVQVHGKVFSQDGTAPKGGIRIVRFEPVEGTPPERRRVASGEIGNDGSFELFTKRPGDGVYPGEYNVTFTVWKGQHEPISLIEDKFTAAATTPFKNVKVASDSDEFTFKIESRPIAADEATSQAH